MSLATKTTVSMSCGHPVEMDLTRMKPFDRKDAIKRWGTTGLCFNCDPAKQADWKKKVAEKDAQRERELAGKRAQALADALASETRFGIHALNGISQKQIDWATVVRIDLITRAWEITDLEEDEFSQVVTDPAGQVDSARWWIDHRETNPGELAEALKEALTDDENQLNENPF